MRRVSSLAKADDHEGFFLQDIKRITKIEMDLETADFEIADLRNLRNQRNLPESAIIFISGKVARSIFRILHVNIFL